MANLPGTIKHPITTRIGPINRFQSLVYRAFRYAIFTTCKVWVVYVLIKNVCKKRLLRQTQPCFFQSCWAIKIKVVLHLHIGNAPVYTPSSSSSAVLLFPISLCVSSVASFLMLTSPNLETLTTSGTYSSLDLSGDPTLAAKYK